VVVPDLLISARIQNFWFHDLRRTFASRYMMNGGLYELAKMLGHSNIKVTRHYAKLGRGTSRRPEPNTSLRR